MVHEASNGDACRSCRSGMRMWLQRTRGCMPLRQLKASCMTQFNCRVCTRAHLLFLPCSSCHPRNDCDGGSIGVKRPYESLGFRSV